MSEVLRNYIGERKTILNQHDKFTQESHRFPTSSVERHGTTIQPITMRKKAMEVFVKNTHETYVASYLILVTKVYDTKSDYPFSPSIIINDTYSESLHFHLHRCRFRSLPYPSQLMSTTPRVGNKCTVNNVISKCIQYLSNI